MTYRLPKAVVPAERRKLFNELRAIAKPDFHVEDYVLADPDGFHVCFYDLDRMDRRALKKLLKRTPHDVTDKGLWFK